MLKALKEFTQYMRWMQHSARWLPTLEPCRSPWASECPDVKDYKWLLNAV